ncbi:hypothetical protein [Natronolimnobius baerhuensis]|uniref:Uncharacterized protein n=1 Tax=Natronolimnobius baerhuensis TaxID=253108 RepID=A0A202ED94_9EURY|nr:hypothetical protein [Natronolimnobius baerhuensis]OVE86195.1 hypothetical protein B2G88_05255 [Natronolimnobius baerhuensis]
MSAVTRLAGGQTTTWRLFTTLVREEWRLHVRLFGGWRFAGFPLVIAALAIGGVVALETTGTDATTIVTGLHVLALGFGLYSGTAAFAGSSMLENVFGRLSLVLSTAETLPLSRRRLLGLFLLKDLLFYGLVVVAPMALAAVPLAAAGDLSFRALLEIPALWLSLGLVFAAGMTVTVALIAARSRSVPVWIIGLSVVILALGLWTTGLLEPARGLLVPVSGSLATAGGLALATAIASVTAVAAFDPTDGRPAQREATSARFGQLRERLPTGTRTDALVAKSLLDLTRSAGGVWKPFVSAGILFALVVGLVGVVESITGIEPAPGILFGGVLGLSAFTTYNWLTQFDSLEAYRIYPVSVTDVFRAKRIAFVLVGAPAVAVPYLAAVLWYGATPLDAAVGAVLLAGYGLYYYGLTVAVAGFDPNEFLFDSVRFTGFTVGIAIPLVPALVAGFVTPSPTPILAVGLAGAGLVCGALGYILSSRAGPRWERRYREGNESAS